MASPKGGRILLKRSGEEIKYGGKENMWKYLVTLMVLLSMGGLVGAAAPTECTDCYSNIITQADTQTIENVALTQPATAACPNCDVPPTSTVGNEALSAAIIVTPALAQPACVGTSCGPMFITGNFARIDQKIDQTLNTLGTTETMGAKGLTWNKAIQAAWVANQGVKELEPATATALAANYQKEGAYVSQITTQSAYNIQDYKVDGTSKVLNVDNKLAMIVDNLQAVINLNANAASNTADTENSAGTVTTPAA
jgi:hypothetical protein